VGQKEEKTMATIQMLGGTGADDLRDNCHAVPRIFVTGFQGPFTFDPVLNGQGPNTSFFVQHDIAVNNPDDIISFQFEHVSREDFGQSRDNWDMNGVTFNYINGAVTRFPIASSHFHRFTGDTAVLTIPRK
jgi:hypothetical protein